jgi:DNA-binding NarL/FixJ family response regulator
MEMRILLADDHQIFREGLSALINAEKDMKVVGQAGNGREALFIVKEMKPDIVILDISMPELNGIDAAVEIKMIQPGIKIIALSMHSDKRYIKRILEAGATGYLLKSCASRELIQAIRAVRSNRSFFSDQVMEVILDDYTGKSKITSVTLEHKKLSRREMETLQLIAEGKSLKEIAVILGVSIKSIEVYKKQLMNKLNIDNIAGLIKYAIREGITFLD